jgi:hypothetical protein
MDGTTVAAPENDPESSRPQQQALQGCSGGSWAASSPPPTSVHPQETSQPTTTPTVLCDYTAPRDEFRVPPISQLETTFRHSGWAICRQRVWDQLNDGTQSINRVDRFANCGSGAVVQYSHKEDRVRISANYCHDRLCLPCAAAKAAQVKANIITACQGKLVRFMTLTLRHSRSSLRDQVDRLYREFAILRRRRFFKSNVAGGIAVMETKLSDRDGLWHVHLHCLIETKWLDQKQLSQEWLAVTGDSSIVDIRQVQGEEAIRYVAKYAAKGTDNSTYTQPEALREYIAAIKGRRLILAWGSFRGRDYTAVPEDPGDWVSLGSLGKLAAEARCGNVTAHRILEQLSTRVLLLLASPGG